MCEHASHIPSTEADALKARIADLEALLSGAQSALAYEQDSARRVEAQYYEAKTSLTRACNVFDVIWQRGDIDLDDDSDYAELAELIGFERLVEVWVTVKAEWSQKVSLPRGYDESKVNIVTEVDDRLTVTYDDRELDEELTQDQFEVEVSE